MAEQDKQQDADNTGPAASGGSAGTAPATPAADPQSDPQGQAEQTTPAATGQAGQPGAEPPPADGGDATGETTDDGIRDNWAYYKAQAEKFQRLHEKAEQAREEMERRLKDRSDDDAAQIRQEHEQIMTELKAERERAATLEMNALKLRIGAKHGLNPELAERLVGDDEESIAEDAQRLAALIPQGGRKPNVGNPAGDSTGKPGWMTKKVDPFSGE